MAFGADVRRLRKARGLSLERLAEKSGLSTNYVASLETKARDPSLSTVHAIAKALGVPLSELVKDRSSAISPAGMDAARHFDKLPSNVQDAVLGLLRTLVAPPAAPPVRPRRTRRAGGSG